MFIIKVANLLEAMSVKLKLKYNDARDKAFIKKYSINGCNLCYENENNDYNRHKVCNVSIIEKLINLRVIKEDDHIMDVGCGIGYFLLFLASKNFKNLYGVEIDERIYQVCLQNFKNNNFEGVNYKIKRNDVTMSSFDDNVNVIFLFNTFKSTHCYIDLCMQIEQSLVRNDRDIKILLLYPLEASLNGLDSVNWLRKSDKIYDECQICSECVYYQIYEYKKGKD